MPNEAAVKGNIEQSFLMHRVFNISAKLQDKQAMLEENNITARAEKLLQLLQVELQLAELKNEITNKTRADIDRQQREYFLQQQLKSIREELGGDPNEREVKDLQKRAEEMKWTDTAKELFKKNIEKLERMHPSTPDCLVIPENHSESDADLPWGVYTEEAGSGRKAQKVLDEDHC